MAKKPERPKPDETVEDMVGRTYRNKELAARVLQEVEAAGTRDRIESGELVLPHPHDARLHFARIDAEAARKREEES